MNIAILNNGKVANTAVFDDFSTAQDFLKNKVWSDADAVVELEEGFGIGDSYINVQWIKQELPEQPELPEEPPLDMQLTDGDIGYLKGMVAASGGEPRDV